MPRKKTKISSTTGEKGEADKSGDAPAMAMALVAPDGITAIFVGPTSHEHGQVVFCCEPECERVLVAHGYTWQLVPLSTAEEDE